MPDRRKPYGEFPPTTPRTAALVSDSFRRDADRWIESYTKRNSETIRRERALFILRSELGSAG